MRPIITRTAKLLPYTRWTKPAAGHATAYSYEPPADSHNPGQLLVVAEAVAPHRQAEEVIDTLIDTAGRRYYNHPQAEDDLAERFEATIKAVNQALNGLINSSNAAWVGKLSAIIAISTDSELHLAHAGSAELYLYRRGRSNRVTTASSKRAAHQPLKTFDNITSGQLEIGDHLLLATPGLIHQIPEPQLRQIVSDSSPAAAVTKLTELLKDDERPERIAALVAEITTPDLLALQIRTSEPEAVQLGQPEGALATAKSATAPLAAQAAATARRSGRQATEWTRQTVLPRVRGAGTWAATRLGQAWLNPRQRQWLIGGAGVTLLLLILLVWRLNASQALNSQRTRYYAILSQVRQAESQFDAGQADPARTALDQAAAQLASLRHDAVSGLDASLASANRPASDPSSLNALQQLVNADLDKVNGLQVLTGATVTTLSTNQPRFVEVVGHQLVMLGQSASGHILTYDLTTQKLKTSTASLASVGTVAAATTSSTGDGVYILTKQPGVWLYQPSTDTLTQINISFGNWPAGRAIASYAGNLYILGPDNLTKHTPSLAGFAAGSNYFSGADATTAGQSTTLAIDGAINLASGVGVERYLGGVLQQSLTALPASLNHPSQLRSLNNGERLLLLDGITHRLAVLTGSGANLTLTKQYSLSSSTQLYDVAAEPTTGAVYCLTDGRVVKVSL